jgi:hypothetical protein
LVTYPMSSAAGIWERGCAVEGGDRETGETGYERIRDGSRWDRLRDCKVCCGIPSRSPFCFAFTLRGSDGYSTGAEGGERRWKGCEFFQVSYFGRAYCAGRNGVGLLFFCCSMCLLVCHIVLFCFCLLLGGLAALSWSSSESEYQVVVGLMTLCWLCCGLIRFVSDARGPIGSY